MIFLNIKVATYYINSIDINKLSLYGAITYLFNLSFEYNRKFLEMIIVLL